MATAKEKAAEKAAAAQAAAEKSTDGAVEQGNSTNTVNPESNSGIDPTSTAENQGPVTPSKEGQADNSKGPETSTATDQGNAAASNPTISEGAIESSPTENQTSIGQSNNDNPSDVVKEPAAESSAENPKHPLNDVVASIQPKEPEAAAKSNEGDSGFNDEVQVKDPTTTIVDPLSLTVINNGANHYEMALKRQILTGENKIHFSSLRQKRIVLRNLGAINALHGGSRFVFTKE